MQEIEKQLNFDNPIIVLSEANFSRLNATRGLFQF